MYVGGGKKKSASRVLLFAFFEFLCHQTVILMLKSTCELYRIIRKVLLLLGSTVDSCYVSASHPQAQKMLSLPGVQHDFQILKVARLRPSCPTLLATREKSSDRVVLVSSQRNVDVTFVDDLLCHTRGYLQNSEKKKKKRRNPDNQVCKRPVYFCMYSLCYSV